jgi:CBS domain-containing protein
MSLKTQEEFLQNYHPFDYLNQVEIDLCINNIDISYYAKGEVIISPSNISKYFFIIIKGEVNEYKGEELIAVYQEHDSFDSNSLIYEKTDNTFKVSTDLICYELNKTIFLKLINLNKKFKKYYLQDLSNKLQNLKTKEYSNEMSSFMVSKVNEIYIHRACIVDVSSKVCDAISKSIEYKTSTIVVKDEKNYGIITDSVLKKEVLLKGCDLNISCKQIAIFPFICVNNDDFLFQVLMIFTKYTIKRVGVLKNGILVGTLDQVDILSYFANHVHIIAMQIQKADTIDELKKASHDITKTVKSLFIKSVKTTYIAKMVAQLNKKVYAKLFELVVPKDLQNTCALLVMGSEGRDEQILKTDQDNALIIKNNTNKEQYIKYMQEFTSALLKFGFPKCDGDIMVTNSYWRKTQDEFETQISKWLLGNKLESYMDLAIFFDAKVVAGDKTLLKELKENLFLQIQNNDVYMAYFAKATLNFDTPISMFSNLIAKNNEIDLKKGAIFAIVQGIRSLALEYKLYERATISRIKKLNEIGVIQRDMASELIEAFGLLLRLKVHGQIKNMNNNKQITNKIDINSFSKIQRDMLRDSFIIVNSFKKFISNHFKLSNIS